MNTHLELAREYIGKGEQYYKQAVAEILLARAEGCSWTETNDALGRGDKYAQRLVGWHETPANERASTPFAEESGQVARRHTKAVLRESTPEQVEEIVASLPPESRATLASALEATGPAHAINPVEVPPLRAKNHVGQIEHDVLKMLDAARLVAGRYADLKPIMSGEEDELVRDEIASGIMQVEKILTSAITNAVSGGVTA